MADAFDAFPGFLDALRARLEAGRVAYGDRSFERPPAELLSELEAEALDLAGWGAVLHERIRRLRERCEDAGPANRLPPQPISPARREVPAAPNASSRAVVVVPLERVEPIGTVRTLSPIALSRVPVQGECVLDDEGRNLHVVGVRHLPSGDVAAELHVEHLRPPLDLAAARTTATGGQRA